jgi:opacity protein-like surface antigen
MKKLTLSIATIVAMSSFGFAGGDIEPLVEPKVNVPEVKTVVAPTHSSAGFYVGIAYAYGMEGDRSANYMPSGALAADDGAWEVAGMILAGYQINDFFAVEGRFTSSLDDFKYNDQDITDYDLTNAAIYAKVMYPVQDVVTMYALLGYGQTTIDDKGVADNEYETDGLQWGVGASYSVNKNLSVFADYTKLALVDEYDVDGVTITHTEDLDVSAINVGVSYKF